MVSQHRGIEEFRVSAVGAVPGVATVGPGQVQGEGRKEVVEGPGNDDVVVKANIEGNEDHGVAYPCVGTKRSGFRSIQSHSSSLTPGSGLQPLRTPVPSFTGSQPHP